MTEIGKEASHRTSKLRKIQNLAVPRIETIIRFLDKKGAFPKTKIHETMSDRTNLLHADNITLTQLQMTAQIFEKIEYNQPFPEFPITYLLTSLLNGADGPIARRLGTTSKEGGIKDATVDRLTEIMIAELITRKLHLPKKLEKELKISFQLSTLTKAVCEMVGVKTEEAGMGSMLERRTILFFVLRDLLKLNNTSSLETVKRKKILKNIMEKIEYLIKNSIEKAEERIKKISEKTNEVKPLEDSDSTSASEARKYAGVVKVNNAVGIDIVSELNKLSGGLVVFPTLDQLSENYDYIQRSLVNAGKFINTALSITDPYLQFEHGINWEIDFAKYDTHICIIK